jgi:hypothetical protein
MAEPIGSRRSSVKRSGVLNDARKPPDFPAPVWGSAKCLYHPNPDWFFDNIEVNNAREQKKFCSDCPVISECLEYALNVNVSGIWGGTTPRERKAIRKELNITPHIFSFTMIDAYRARGKEVE